MSPQGKSAGRGGSSGGLGSRALRAPLGLLGALAYWMPVWIPLGLLAQLALLGLRPALCEQARLEQREAVIGARLEHELRRREELSAFLAALSDPIYRERLRLERRGE